MLYACVTNCDYVLHCYKICMPVVGLLYVNTFPKVLPVLQMIGTNKYKFLYITLICMLRIFKYIDVLRYAWKAYYTCNGKYIVHNTHVQMERSTLYALS